MINDKKSHNNAPSWSDAQKNYLQYGRSVFKFNTQKTLGRNSKIENMQIFYGCFMYEFGRRLQRACLFNKPYVHTNFGVNYVQAFKPRKLAT